MLHIYFVLNCKANSLVSDHHILMDVVTIFVSCEVAGLQ